VDRLDAMIAEILGVRDCPAVRNLVTDCWRVGLAGGEAEGLAHAAVVLAGVRAFVAHGRAVRAAVPGRNHGN
jgi:hypothetical protein